MCVRFVRFIVIIIIIVMVFAAMIVGVTARFSVASSPVSIISRDDVFGSQMVGFFGIPRTVRLVGVQREFNQP